LLYERVDKRGYDRIVFPLLSAEGKRDGDSYDVLFPLLWQFASKSRGTSTTVTPVSYFHRDPDGWSVGVGPIVPLFYARSGKTRSHAVLFPIFWHFHDAEERRTTTVVGPFWHRSWGDETENGLFPLVYFRHGARPGGGDVTTRAVLPFFFYHRDADQ